jgi:hypothetical protein
MLPHKFDAVRIHQHLIEALVDTPALSGQTHLYWLRV